MALENPRFGNRRCIGVCPANEHRPLLVGAGTGELPLVSAAGRLAVPGPDAAADPLLQLSLGDAVRQLVRSIRVAPPAAGPLLAGPQLLQPAMVAFTRLIGLVSAVRLAQDVLDPGRLQHLPHAGAGFHTPCPGRPAPG